MTMMKLTAAVLVSVVLIDPSSGQTTYAPTPLLATRTSFLPTSFPFANFSSTLAPTPTNDNNGSTTDNINETVVTNTTPPTLFPTSSPTIPPSVAQIPPSSSPSTTPSESASTTVPTGTPTVAPTRTPTSAPFATVVPTTPSTSGGNVIEVSSGFDMSQVSLASAEEYDDEVLAVAVSAVGMVPARDVDVDVSASGFLVAVEYEIVTESASEVSERLEAATEEDFEREIRNAANGVTDAFDEVVVSSLWDVEVERSSSKKKSGGDVLTPTVVAVLFFACLVCVLAAIVCCVRRRHRRDTWGQWPDEANFDDVVELPSRHGPPSSTPPKYLHDRDENDDDFVSQEPSYI